MAKVTLTDGRVLYPLDPVTIDYYKSLGATVDPAGAATPVAPPAGIDQPARDDIAALKSAIDGGVEF